MFDGSAFDAVFKMLWILLVVAVISVPFAIWKIVGLIIYYMKMKD